MVLLSLTFLKSVFIGSSFNFWYFMKYGNEYLEWYNSIMDQKFVPKWKQMKELDEDHKNG